MAIKFLVAHHLPATIAPHDPPLLLKGVPAVALFLADAQASTELAEAAKPRPTGA